MSDIKLNGGKTTMLNTLWVIICSILVFYDWWFSAFYSGLVQAHNAINTIKMNFICIAIIIPLWIIIGCSLTFSSSSPFMGNFDYFFFDNMIQHGFNDLSEISFAIFQMMFAIIAVALMSDAVVERIQFKAFILFVALWSIIFYSTTAHWVWSEHGWMAQWGMIDYAGGFAIHIGAGFSSLVLAKILKPRIFIKQSESHNIPFVIIGICILWFGCYGFNAGSALAMDKIALVSFINTALAPCIAILTWLILDTIKKCHFSAVNVAVATVIGLVSITPGAGFINIYSALII